MLNIPENYPESLRELAECIYQQLRLSIPDNRCSSLAFEITEGIRQGFGGISLYVPKGEKFDRIQRDAAIVEAFDGTNHRKLAKNHGLSLVQIYEIVSKPRLQ